MQTAEKFRGDWMLTGDRGVWEGDYLRFVGREDDVITSAGYRIGPAEIEDCLLTHPAVATVRRCGQARRAAHRDRQGLCGAETGLARK